MKKHLSKILGTALLFTLVGTGSLFAQCTTAGFGQYPSATYTPNPCNVNTTVTTCAYDGEYSLVNLTAGNSYQFTMNYGDYITIADNATNTAQVWGVTPVVFNCTTSGVYRFYRHLDAACGESSALCRTASVMQIPGLNDACAGAIAITPGTVSGNTSCATTDAVALCGTATVPNSGGLWYKYTPACSGNITASLCTGTAYNSQVSVFSGTCGSLVCVSGNDDFCATQSSTTWAGAAGTTYYILVHGNASTGAFTMTLTQTDATAPVPDVASLPVINASCAVTLTAPTATDNCAGSITGTTPQMTYSVNGTYNVVWTYNDGNGNTSTQNQTVNVNDNVGPVSLLPSDTTITADPGQCCATLTYNTSTTAAFTQAGNSFEDGWTNNGVYSTTDDMNVPAGTTWTAVGATFNAFNAAPLPSSIDVYIYDDAGGYPGTVLYNETVLAGSYTYTYVGTNFGYPVYEYGLTLASPVTLAGGGSGATYWIAFQCNGAGASFWEINSTGTYGNNALQVFGDLSTADFSGGYVNAGADHVYSLSITQETFFADACGGPVTVVQNSGPVNGACFTVGTHNMSYTGTDENGNSTTHTFTVTVQDNENPTPDLDSSATYSFSSTTLPVAIPNSSSVSDSVLVSGVPTTLNPGDLASICLDINHSFDSDISIDLISPSGTILSLSANNGGPDDDYNHTCFDMNASQSILAGSAPFIGSYIPQGAGGFSVFDGEDPNGYWKIVITDGISPDNGSLNEFHVNFDFHWADLLPSAHINCGSVPTPTASDNCGATINATTSDPTSFTADGTYNITWTYTDAAGNVTTQTQEVVVDDIVPPVPSQASIPPTTGSCSATAESVPTAVDGCTGATINGTTTDPLTYNVAGTYTITWTYDDGNGNTTTQTQTIIVTDTQDPVPSQTILPNVVGNCTVTVSTIPTATDNCSGTINGTTTDPLVYNVVGTFFITWTYTDVNGNTHTQNQTVVVNPCLGIEDESGQWNALIYPNPSSGIFTLSLSEMPTENTEIKLIDGLGQVLYSGVLQNQVQQFDFSHLASATYYLLITNNNGHISKPIIIRQNY